MINLDDPTLIADPYPSYQQWRDEQPVWWSDGELKGWILSRYDDVRAVLKDAQTFSSKSMGEGETQVLPLPLLTDAPPPYTAKSHRKQSIYQPYTEANGR